MKSIIKLIVLNRLGGQNMLASRGLSCEDAILDGQECESDRCRGCEFASVELCKNQCMEVENVYNPNLISLIQ